jgi:uncharacterized protein (TIGR00369 family)
MGPDELNDFFDAAFEGERNYRVASVDEDVLHLHLDGDRVMLRPGGTVSGPTLMAMADAAAYARVLSLIGPVALAVTSSLHITFLRKPVPGDVDARARVLKLGRTLAVVDVRLHTAGRAEAVAQATVTYAIPQDRDQPPPA